MSGIVDQSEAHRRFGAAYFTELLVAGVRCFGPEQHLSILDGSRAAKWTVILGENGVGKTTLLQCAWGLAPYVPEARLGAFAGSIPRFDEIPRSSLSLRRTPASSLKILANLVLDEPLTSAQVGAAAAGGLRSSSPGGEMVASYPGWTNVACCGYGALRRSGDGSLQASASEHSAASLFTDGAELIRDARSRWLPSNSVASMQLLWSTARVGPPPSMRSSSPGARRASA